MSKSRIDQPAQRWPLIAAVLLAGVALLYSPVMGFPFLQVDDNPRLLQQDLNQLGLSWAFQNPFAWQPLTWISHQLDFRLFGVQNSGAHHAVNVGLHLACVGLLVWLLVKLTGQVGVSVAAAALFALHPLRVESVAWVSGRGDLLAALFVLLAIEVHRRGVWWAAVLLGGLAMTASPSAALVGLVIAALDVWLLGRTIDWRECGALLGLGALALVLRTMGGPDHDTLLGTAPVFPLMGTVASQLAATVWPVGLSAMRAPGANLLLAGPGLLAVFLAAAACKAKSTPAGTRWGLAVFVLFAVPAAFLPSVWGWADHTSYLPQMGLMVALAFAVPVAMRPLAGKLLAVPLLVWVALSWGHLNDFRGTVPLLEQAVAAEAGNAEARLGLGLALAGQGDPVGAEKQLRLVTKARPEAGLAWVWLGKSLTSQRRSVDALAVMDEAVRKVPTSGEARFERGIALQNVNRVPEAEASFVAALNLGLDARTGAIAYNNLGSYAAQRKEFARAEKLFEQAIALDLRFALAHKNYAMTLVAQDQRQKAINHLERKALLWTGNDRMVGEYLTALMNLNYADQYKKEQQQMALEQELEKKAELAAKAKK